MTPSKRQSGFTLLEALIAIMILAGIAIALGPAVNAAARASSRIHQYAGAAEDLRTARQFFQDVIAQNVQFSSGSDDSRIEGNANELTLVTLDQSRMTPVTIKLAISAGVQKDLSARFSAPDDEGAQTYVLLANLSDAQFEYLESDDVTGLWRNDWRETTPPALIRLTGVIQHRQETRQVAFEAAPRGAAPLNCQFDPVSRRCR